MPRDLGKAKRADLTGKFPGEQAEYGSALARFLEGSGQLKPLAEGTYIESSGNGHGTETETGRGGRSKDTEVAPPRGGNGQHSSTDTVFDTQLNDAFAEEEMFPEADLSPDPMTQEALSPEPLSPQPLIPQPAPQALSPEPPGRQARRHEPQSLDSVPDLLSPELDALAEESSDDPADDTELLADRHKPVMAELSPAVPDLAPPEHSDDTGMLIAEAFSTRKEDGWDSVEMDNLEDDEQERKITDKLNRRPEGDEDLTKVFKADSHAHDGEKITNKVEPKRDVDPRTQDPNAVVRDTVNFYNQTQSFQEARKNQAFPTISPTVVNSGQPISLRGQPIPDGPEAELVPSLDATDDTDTLRPGPAETIFDEVESQDAGPTLGPLESLEAAPEPAPAELGPESGLEEADKHETDKFTREDREPPQLPLPEGTDKIDKSQAPPRRRAASAGAKVEGLEPLSDEKVAAGKDTQRFYVAEILAKKAASDSTDELQPAEEGLPPRPAESTRARAAETSTDYTTGKAPQPGQRPSKRQRAIEPAPLPGPREVHTDFIEHIHVSSSERMIPGLEDEQAREDDSDDTVDEEAAIERTTDKLGAGRPPQKPPSGRRATAGTDSGRRAPTRATEPKTASGRSGRVSEAVSQRLELERAETLRLIEQAEAVALRLRAASDASHGDLNAISVRRETARASRSALQQRARERDESAGEAETLYDFPPLHAPAPSERKTDEIAPRPQAEARHRQSERVPTRAIGEIVDELQRSAVRPATSLSDLLDHSSRKQAPAGGNGNNGAKAHPDDDIDLWVAASSRLRETVESAREEDHESGRVPANADAPRAAEVIPAEPRTFETTQARRASQSTLSGDLDRLWQVLDSRRSSAVSDRALEPCALEPATLLIPAADKARITAREPNVPALEDGWTQEMLWPTLAGIAVVTFALGAIFVWVLVRALA